MGRKTVSGQVAAEVEPRIGNKQDTLKLNFKGTAGTEQIKEINLDSGVLEKPRLNMAGAGVRSAPPRN